MLSVGGEAWLYSFREIILSKFRGIPEAAKMRRGKSSYYHTFLIIGIQILGTQLHILHPEDWFLLRIQVFLDQENKEKNHHLGVGNQKSDSKCLGRYVSQGSLQHSLERSFLGTWIMFIFNRKLSSSKWQNRKKKNSCFKKYFSLPEC